jgi:SpoIID/LytB domain protein
MTRSPFAVVAVALLAACAFAVGVAASAKAPAATPASFLITGGGWGHGVGMSQWGAYGQARAGRRYDEILRHYYTGVELGPIPASVPKTLRVLVGDALSSVTISSTQPFRLRDATGTTYPLPPTGITLTADLTADLGDTGEPVTLTGPLLVLPAKDATLAFADRQYRSNLRVAVVQKKLQVVNVVPLETYLLGVVPGEMPKDWPVEALKAQAVAARTYAIWSLVKGKSFDLFSDWRSQMYYGAGAEAPGPTKAVRDTRGQVILYDGLPISALYFSSSGGRTANAVDVYGNDVPYLVSVDDPWDETSPFHTWAPRPLTGAALAKGLGLGSPVVDAVTVPGAQDAPSYILFTTAAGGTTKLRITEVRGKLGLRSSSFRLGVLRLTRPPGRRTAAPVELSGVARDVDSPALQKLNPAGNWVSGPALALAADGSFAVTVRPPGALTVRLVADGLVGASLTIPAVGGG